MCCAKQVLCWKFLCPGEQTSVQGRQPNVETWQNSLGPQVSSPHGWPLGLSPAITGDSCETADSIRAGREEPMASR